MRDRHWDTSIHSRGSSQPLSLTQLELQWLHIPGLLPLLSEYMRGKEQENLCSTQSTDHILQGVRNEEPNDQVCLYTPVCLTPFLPLPHLHSQVTKFSHPRAGSSQEFSHRLSKQRRNRLKALVCILQLLFCFPVPSGAQPHFVLNSHTARQGAAAAAANVAVG